MVVEYTIWIDKEAKVNPAVSAYILNYILVYNIGKCAVPGLVVKVDMTQMIGKKYTKSSISLVKSNETEIKNEEIKLPWLDKDYYPAIKCAMATIKDGKCTILMYTSHYGVTYAKGELMNKKEIEIYIENAKQFYSKVTGQKIAILRCFGGKNKIN
jgi:hypothetical protein